MNEQGYNMGDFDERFKSFVKGCQNIIDQYYKDRGYTQKPPQLTVSPGGRKYLRIVRENSVYCFVEVSTGDVLKSAGWSTPAKHARGNIFAEDNGLSRMTEFGAAYLR